MVRRLEHVYLGRDNRIDLVLLADGVVSRLDGITKMRLEIGSTVLDSQTCAGVFDWTQTVSAEEAARYDGISEGDSKVILALGGQEISPGSYEARLILFDSSNPNGLVWGHIPILVYA